MLKEEVEFLGRWWMLALLIASLCPSRETRADIIYSGPLDIVISNEWEYLDFNNDTSTDLMFSHGSTPTSFQLRREPNIGQPDYTNRVVCGGFDVLPLSLGYSIGPSLAPVAGWGTVEWYVGGDRMGDLMDGEYAGGYWVGATNMYVGAELMIDGAIHYGWAQYSVASNNLVATLHDFAYEGVAGQSIAAGAIPEPHTALLLGAGMLTLLLAGMKRGQQRLRSYSDPLRVSLPVKADVGRCETEAV